VREFDLTAQFYLNIFERSQILFEKIHHTNTLTKTDNKMETTWVESNTLGLFLKCVIDFQIKSSLICKGPDLDSTVSTSGRNVGFLDARVHTVDLLCVEGQHQVTVVDFIGRSFHVD
jgi:hypothetical protein